MDEKPKVRLTMDGKEVQVEEGTTILDAARQNGIHIPTLCHHPALSSWGGCRICVVEVDGAPRLVASCVMPVRGGMQVVTQSPRILEARRTVLEFLFAERNHYCMFCAQSGDCELQSLAYELQMDHLTVAFSFNKFPVDVTDEHMVLDHNRCILCGRCVRACRELAGSFVLNYQNRGARALICKDLNQSTADSACDGSGVCLQVCPTGAIFSRQRTHYAVKGKSRPQTVTSVCPQCGALCPAVYHVRDNNLIKVDGLLSTQRADRGQLCRRGRFEPLVTTGERLLTPMVRGRGGAWEKAGWEEALDTVAGRLQAIKAAGGGHALFGLASEDCSNEELLLFREVVSKAFAGSHLGTLDGGHLSTVSQAWGDLAGTFLGLKEAPWTRLPEADLLLLVGVQSGDTQPLVLSLVRRAALEHRVPVEVLGGADVMQPWTRHFVAAKPSDLACLIRALLGRVIGSGQMGNPLVRWRKIADEVGQEPVADFPGSAALEPKSVEAFHAMAAALAQARAPMIVAGTAVSGLRDPEGLKCLMYLALLKGLLPADTLRLVILKPRGNSAGAAKLGYAANGDGPSAVGWRGGIVLLGGREEVPPDVLKPMERLEFLAVIAPQIPAGLADRAHVLIPKPLWLEDEGSYTSLDGREVGRTRRVLSPPAGVKGAWETLAALAARAGLRPDVWTLEGLRDRTAAEMNLMG